MPAYSPGHDDRLLIVSPSAQIDRALAESLRISGISSELIGAHLPDAAGRLQALLAEGAAAVLVSDESAPAVIAVLVSFVGRQASWSDLPILLLRDPGVRHAGGDELIARLGNVLIVENPVVEQPAGANPADGRHEPSIGFLSAVRIVLRARRRQYEARAHLEAQRLADRRKDEFLATLAHELRNPLAPMQNALEVLKQSVTIVDGRPVQLISRQLAHLVRLIDDLFEVSRISRGRLAIVRTQINLADVLAAAIEATMPAVQARHHTLHADYPEAMTLSGDFARLTQVFVNVLDNAARFMPDGGLIVLHGQRDADMYVIDIRDTGRGIPADILPHVFEPFVQGKHDRHGPGSGLGIGLALVRALVELHGGSVTAHRDAGGLGSRFRIRLPALPTTRPEAGSEAASDAEEAVAVHPDPISGSATLDQAPDHAPADGDGPALAAPPTTGRLPSDGAAPAGRRILVVDDNRDAADSLAELIQLLGGVVSVAYRGDDALARIVSDPPDLVFLDLAMPGMDGLTVAQRVRSTPNLRQPTLIALTGWGLASDLQSTRDAGFDRHIVKPVNLQQLKEIITATQPGGAEEPDAG